jgi:hypothetical protein
VIRNVVVHISNEQPLLADLYDIPAASDAGLLCVNLRLMDGKRPVFIDNIGNSFFFPYHVIRFLEMTTASLERHRAETGQGAGQAGRSPQPPISEEQSILPAVIEVGSGETAAGLDMGEEIDEDFLRRIREV